MRRAISTSFTTCFASVLFGCANTSTIIVSRARWPKRFARSTCFVSAPPNSAVTRPRASLTFSEQTNRRRCWPSRRRLLRLRLSGRRKLPSRHKRCQTSVDASPPSMRIGPIIGRRTKSSCGSGAVVRNQNGSPTMGNEKKRREREQKKKQNKKCSPRGAYRFSPTTRRRQYRRCPALSIIIRRHCRCRCRCRCLRNDRNRF